MWADTQNRKEGGRKEEEIVKELHEVGDRGAGPAWYPSASSRTGSTLESQGTF